MTYYFSLVVCSDIDFIWQRFRNITTFTVYVICCYLEKSFIFNSI